MMLLVSFPLREALHPKSLTEIHADHYSVFSAKQDEAQSCLFVEDFCHDLVLLCQMLQM